MDASCFPCQSTHPPMYFHAPFPVVLWSAAAAPQMPLHQGKFQSWACSCTEPWRHALRTPTLTPWPKRQQHVCFWACCCKVACVPLTVHTPLWESLLCLHLVPCAVSIVRVAQEKQQESKILISVGSVIAHSEITSVLSCMTQLPSLWWLLLWK